MALSSSFVMSTSIESPRVFQHDSATAHAVPEGCATCSTHDPGSIAVNAAAASVPEACTHAQTHKHTGDASAQPRVAGACWVGTAYRLAAAR